MRFQTFVKVDASEESSTVWFGRSVEFRFGQNKKRTWPSTNTQSNLVQF